MYVLLVLMSLTTIIHCHFANILSKKVPFGSIKLDAKITRDLIKTCEHRDDKLTGYHNQL